MSKISLEVCLEVIRGLQSYSNLKKAQGEYKASAYHRHLADFVARLVAQHFHNNEAAHCGPYATSDELAKELGATEDESKQFFARMEFLSGNTPHEETPRRTPNRR
jgi:hypothetical protein